MWLRKPKFHWNLDFFGHFQKSKKKQKVVVAISKIDSSDSLHIKRLSYHSVNNFDLSSGVLSNPKSVPTSCYMAQTLTFTLP